MEIAELSSQNTCVESSRKYPNSLFGLSQTTWVVHEDVVIYSASAVERATIFYFFEDHMNAILPKKNMPEVLLLSLTSPIQSLSAYPVSEGLSLDV